MKNAMTAAGLALVVSLSLGTAANAQLAGKSRNDNKPAAAKQKPAGATVTIGDREVKLSPAFVKAYKELQESVEASDQANIPPRLAAANAIAKTPEERFLVAQLQLKAAGSDEAALGPAIMAVLQSGAAPQEHLPLLYVSLGKIRYNAKQYGEAAAAFEKALQLNPKNPDATSLLAATRQAQGRPQDAIADLQKSIQQHRAAGEKPPENLYKGALALAYQEKLPAAVQLSREWVADYPTTANWRDALRVYRTTHDLDDSITLDVLRLARAVDALESDGEYLRFADNALARGYPGEVKLLLDEAHAAKKLDSSQQDFREILRQATQKSSGERATLDEEMNKALAAATAKPALTTGDLLYGYGEYAKAAEAYRAALGKSGADADLINLHLGMALARAGDTSGATAALNAVGGARAELAKYWLVYLSTRS